MPCLEESYFVGWDQRGSEEALPAQSSPRVARTRSAETVRRLVDKFLVEAGSISLSDLLSYLKALSAIRPIWRFPR